MPWEFCQVLEYQLLCLSWCWLLRRLRLTCHRMSGRMQPMLYRSCTGICFGDYSKHMWRAEIRRCWEPAWAVVSSGWFSEIPCLKSVRHRTIEEDTSVLPWPKHMYMQVHAATHWHTWNAGAGEERNPFVYYRVEFYVFAYNSLCFLSTFVSAAHSVECDSCPELFYYILFFCSVFVLSQGLAI